MRNDKYLKYKIKYLQLKAGASELESKHTFSTMPPDIVKGILSNLGTPDLGKLLMVEKDLGIMATKMITRVKIKKNVNIMKYILLTVIQ